MQALLTVGVVAGLIHCGGGELPPPAGNTSDVDSGTVIKTDGSAGVISIPDLDVEKGLVFGDNGFTDCGGTAGPQTITLKNSSNDTVNFNTTVTTGTSYSYAVVPALGGIPARGSITLQITPAVIPKESDVRTDLYAGTLEVKFPQGGTPAQIRLHQTARGAIIGVSPGSFSLGAVKVGEKGSVPINLTNLGNVEVTATLGVGNTVYSLKGTPTATVVLGAGKSESTPLEFNPIAAGDQPDTLAITYNTSAVHCKTPPATAAITGSGTTSVGVTPGLLDFGQVNCNSTANPQTVTITSTVKMKFTPVLTKGALSAFTLASDADGSAIAGGTAVDVPAASTFKLRVVPKKIDAVSPTGDNAFGDTLTVTTDLVGDAPHSIGLRETAKGGVLSFAPQTIANSANVGSQITTNFTLVNNGNAQVPYVITTTPAVNFESTITTGNAIVGSTAGVLKSTAPTTKDTVVNGSMSVALGAGGGILCADLPPAVPLSITGTGSAVTANPSILNFGSVNCGATADFQKVVISSITSTKIKVELALGPNSPYTLANDAGGAVVPLNSEVTVGPSTPFTLRVVPKLVPIPSSTAANGLGDKLKLTSDIAAEPVKEINLTQTASGAVFTLPLQLTFKQGDPASFAVKNDGNATGSYKTVASGSVSVSGTSSVSNVLPNQSIVHAVAGTEGNGGISVIPEPGTIVCQTPGTTPVIVTKP